MSILENIPYALEKSVCSAVVNCSSKSVRSVCFMLLFRPCILLLIFCLVVLAIIWIVYWCFQLLLLNSLFSLKFFFFFLLYVLWGSVVRCIYVNIYYIFMMEWPLVFFIIKFFFLYLVIFSLLKFGICKSVHINI